VQSIPIIKMRDKNRPNNKPVFFLFMMFFCLNCEIAANFWVFYPSSLQNIGSKIKKEV
jgi:hypothetical protein